MPIIYPDTAMEGGNRPWNEEEEEEEEDWSQLRIPEIWSSKKGETKTTYAGTRVIHPPTTSLTTSTTLAQRDNTPRAGPGVFFYKASYSAENAPPRARTLECHPLLISSLSPLPVLLRGLVMPYPIGLRLYYISRDDRRDKSLTISRLSLAILCKNLATSRAPQ